MSEIEDVNQPRNRAERRAAERGRRRRAAGAALTAGSAALAATAAIAGPGALPAGAVAQTFTVSSTADAGANTLRQAILDANANAGDDTIVFTGAAAAPGAVITLAGTQLNVTDNVDIQGPGVANLTISGNATTRIFYLDAPDLVTISNLVIANGNTGAGGGGIVSGGADLVLDGVVLADNTAADDGGGVDFEGAGATLTVRNSTITGNTSTNGQGGGIRATDAAGLQVESSDVASNTAGSTGGGIHADSLTGSVAVTGSRINDNHAEGGAGGGFYADDIDGDITLSNLLVTANTATDGGGGMAWFDTDGAATVSHAIVSGNTAEFGGGLYTNNRDGSAITIEYSTFSGNTATDGDGGGLYADEFENNGTLEIRNSTFSGNTASDDAGGVALRNFYESTSAAILNTTITGNTAGENGGAGAIYYVAALDIVQSTITGNTAGSVGGLYLYGEVDTVAAKSADPHHGGNDDGVQSEHKAHSRAIGDGNNNLVGTILAGNQGVDLGPQGAVTSDHSILGVVDPGIVVTDAGGTQFGVDPMLEAPAANGGPTLTMALLPGSPAKDAGPEPEPAFPGSGFDQRGDGFARVVDGRADVGAFEVQAPQPVPEPVVITPKFTG